MTHIIDGKIIASQLQESLKQHIITLQTDKNIMPHLAVIIVGDDPASQVYVASKERNAKNIGMKSTLIRLADNVSQGELNQHITDLNNDKLVHGILVQLPLPKHLDEEMVINLIDPKKDVDGFHPINVGYLHNGQADKALTPCTPTGSIILLKSFCSDLSGKHAVVVGRSNIVGRPIAEMLLQENCTVTIAHSRTQNLGDICKQADILIAAVGKPHFIKADWVKNNAIIIDVGINRIHNTETGKSKLVGDVDFDAVQEKTAAITPVPGGVGPMTIACLLQNTIKAAYLSIT
ncbi:MAG: methylenetetrahydrofolate dehydrogenase (NADP+)/methenyltetrahydrofolate cyclohydrolase [Alphaproteobacteria bacterium]|jgi:methylenetetrahydrofolate dehydrogenase (NADP+)/methenyltetrahydrofolate cyclohydrolase